MEKYRESWLRRHRRLVRAVVLLLFSTATYCVVAFFIDPWSPLFNEEQELDLNSGQARFTKHVFYIRTQREVCDTSLSRALGSGADQGEGRKWVKVNVFGLGGGNSPHFFYHGAFFQVGQMANIWNAGHFDEPARAKTARQLLQVWRDGGSYHAAGSYFGLLTEIIVSRPSGQAVTARDIPDDLVARSLSPRGEGSRRLPSSNPKSDALCDSHGSPHAVGP